MRIVRDPAELDHGPRNVAIGSFDGVHRGHRRVIEALRASAEAAGRRSTVMTFDPHPRVVLGNGVELLTTLERRLELLAETGVDEALVVPFTLELAGTEAAGFV